VPPIYGKLRPLLLAVAASNVPLSQNQPKQEGAMLFDFAEISAKDRYKLLVSTITPRPIAWVVSQSLRGVLNAAPFSFFNAFAGDPPVVGIGIGSHQWADPRIVASTLRRPGSLSSIWFQRKTPGR
jgi:hypothetical protein